jgi:hypothetical protein
VGEGEALEIETFLGPKWHRGGGISQLHQHSQNAILTSMARAKWYFLDKLMNIEERKMALFAVVGIGFTPLPSAEAAFKEKHGI